MRGKPPWMNFESPSRWVNVWVWVTLKKMGEVRLIDSLVYTYKSYITLTSDLWTLDFGNVLFKQCCVHISGSFSMGSYGSSGFDKLLKDPLESHTPEAWLEFSGGSLRWYVMFESSTMSRCQHRLILLLALLQKQCSVTKIKLPK